MIAENDGTLQHQHYNNRGLFQKKLITRSIFIENSSLEVVFEDVGNEGAERHMAPVGFSADLFVDCFVYLA